VVLAPAKAQPLPSLTETLHGWEHAAVSAPGHLLHWAAAAGSHVVQAVFVGAWTLYTVKATADLLRTARGRRRAAAAAKLAARAHGVPA
jgi:hypothetical protein